MDTWRFGRDQTSMLLFGAALALSLVIAGCGGDSSPASPGGGGGGGGGSLIGAVPEIPRPAHRLDDAPLQSDTLVAVARLQGDFTPVVTDIRCDWSVNVYARLCSQAFDPKWHVLESTGWQPMGRAYVSKLTFHANDLGITFNIGQSWGGPRARLVKSGAFVAPTTTAGKPLSSHALFISSFLDPSNFKYHGNSYPPCVFLNEWWNAPMLDFLYRGMNCDRLTKPVYLKRERYWNRIPIGGQMLLRIDPGQERNVSTSYKAGITNTESNTFGWSLGAEVGASKKVIAGKIAGAINASYSTQVTITQERTVTITDNPKAPPDKMIVYMLWELVDEYSFLDAEGNPYADPRIKLGDLGNADVHGIEEWISATPFDPPFGPF